MDGILPHGKTDPGIIREIFLARPESMTHDSIPTALPRILESYLGFLHEEIEATSAYRILPGILGLLNALAGRRDVLIGLATGNVEAGARIKLERGNLNHFFEFGGFGSDSENRTELVRRGSDRAAALIGYQPDSRDVFVIGDTPRDIDAGREAGFMTVGVATGKYSREELAAAGATLAISDLEQERDQFLRTTRIE